jgi:hypothetical protein
MKKEKVKSKGRRGILLFLIFTAGIGKSEVRIPNIGIGGGIFRSYEGFIGPEVDVRFRFPYNLGLETKNFIYGKDEVLSGGLGEIKGLYFWSIGKFFSPYIGVGVKSYIEESGFSRLKLSPTCGIGVEFALYNFTFSPEISFSEATSFSLSGYYNFIPNTKKKNPQERKITYITTIGGALCGVMRPIAFRLIVPGGFSNLTYEPYRYFPYLIKGSVCGYFTGKLISSWVKKDEGLLISIAKGTCSGLLGGIAYYFTNRATLLIPDNPYSHFSPERGLAVFVTNLVTDIGSIALWTISGAVYGAIAR